MIPLDPKLVKDFLEEIKDHIDNNEELTETLTRKYLEKGLDFHGLFLRSKVALRMTLTSIAQLSSNIEELQQEKRSIIRTDLAFICHIREQYDHYDKLVKNALESSPVKIYAEDLLLHMEYLNDCIETGKPFLGRPNIKKISSSQLDHLHESFDIIIEYIVKNPVPFSFSAQTKIREQCDFVFDAAAFLKSVKSCFEEHSYQLYKPYWAKNFWYLEHNPEYWARMEKYRDLNGIYQMRYDNSTNEMKNLMQDTGAMRIYGDNEIMWMDAAKAPEFDAAFEIKQRYKRLEPIFGDSSVTFNYMENSFCIGNLLSLYEALHIYITRRWEDKCDKPSELIGVIGRKTLLKAIGLYGSLETKLLDLLAFDFDKDQGKPYLVHDKPLLKKGDVFFILPSRFFEVTIERLIDKILSNEVTVNFTVLKGSVRKGIVFENSIECFLKSNGVPFGRVSRNEKKGIPEIDGIFAIDDYVFIYEAKASIPPDTIVDAHNLLKDVLLKAKAQLDIRMELLKNNAGVRDYIEKEAGIQIRDMKVSPFILVNHRTFAGYKELTGSFFCSHYPVVCFDDLKSILIHHEIPIWNYYKENNNYKRSTKPLRCGKELWDFMLDQFVNLETMEKPIVSVSEHGVGYQIVRPISIYDPLQKHFE